MKSMSVQGSIRHVRGRFKDRYDSYQSIIAADRPTDVSVSNLYN